jgi:Concanavalin A-like lectin/glucanases superfamily
VRKKTAVAAFVTAAAVLVCVPGAGAATGLVAHWRFDEGAGTVANDSSVNGFDGSIEGTATWVAGRRGPFALDLGGGSTRVVVGNATALEPSAITVEAWVKRSGSPGLWRYVVSKGATGCVAASYGLYSGFTGGLSFYVAAGSGFSFTLSPEAGTSVWDGQWHHAAGTFDGSTVRLYVDGVEVGSGTPATAPIGYGLWTSNDLLIGSYGGCAGLDFDGAVDEPKIWSRALSAAEIKLSAQGYSFSGFFPPVDNLPTLNSVKAGSAVPVKFSLAGNQGLGVFAAGSPASQRIACSSATELDAIEQTVAAGSSSLSYDAAGDRYVYVWKTSQLWSGTCRQLIVELDDGSVHKASFKFR